MKGGPKPGGNTGKPSTGKTAASSTVGSKGPDPKHLPREFKYTAFYIRDQFLKKIQACSSPLDYND